MAGDLMTAYSNPQTTKLNIKDRWTKQRRTRRRLDCPTIPTGLGIQYEGIGQYSLWLCRNDAGQIEVVKARYIGVPDDTIKLDIRARADSQQWIVGLEGDEVARYGFAMPVQAMWYELCQMARHDLFPIGDEPELSDEDEFEW